MKKKKKRVVHKKKASTRGKRVRRTRAMSAAGPEWSAEFGKMYKPIKRPVTLRLDADVVAWFKVLGKGYQTRINRTLRRVMREGRKAGE